MSTRARLPQQTDENWPSLPNIRFTTEKNDLSGCREAPFASRVLHMKWQDYIQITPGVRSGKPCLTGTRITPTDVLEYLAGGMSEDEILKDFPSLTREHIRAVLAYAAERERRYASNVTA